jgi:hypothetical protein
VLTGWDGLAGHPRGGSARRNRVVPSAARGGHASSRPYFVGGQPVGESARGADFAPQDRRRTLPTRSIDGSDRVHR